MLGEAADVEGPEVHARVAVENPMRHRLAGAAGCGDARCEAAGDEEILELRREPHHRLAVGGDRDRSVDQRLDADFVQDRQALRRAEEDRLEALEILREKLAREFERHALAPASWCVLFPAADRERADVRLQIEDAVGVAESRRRVRRVELLLGDDVLVLDRTGGDRDARHLANALRPDAGGVDDDLALDRSVICDDRLDATAFDLKAGDAHTFADRDAAGARGLGVGHGERIGVDVAVGRNPRRADDAIGGHPGKAGFRLLGAHFISLEAEALRLGQRAADLRQPFLA